MNNNRGSNRRRGRGNNRQQGGNQANRIDSRARGNAPQLLEKYKKMAHDASLNGDRVQSEYYLQFADHYFRVLADSRSVKDEQQRPRQGDRDQNDRDQNDRDQNDRDQDDNDRDDDQGSQSRDNRRDRGRDRDDGRREQTQADSDESDDDESDDDDTDNGSPSENPFTRPSRGRRQPAERQSRGRRPAPEAKSDADADAGVTEGKREDEGPRFDPSSLPPSFSSGDSEERPRRRAARKPRAAAESRGAKGDDAGGEELEAVN